MATPWEIWGELIRRSAAELSPAERVVARVHRLVTDVEMGGWLYNISPGEGEGGGWEELRRTAEAVAIIGAPDVASILVKIADIIEAGDVLGPATWGECVASVDPDGRLEALEESLAASADTVRTKLEEFTLGHLV